MGPDHVTDAMWDHGEVSIGEFLGVAKAVMRNPDVGISNEHRRQFGDAIEIFRRLGRDDQIAALAKLETKYRALKSRRLERERR